MNAQEQPTARFEVTGRGLVVVEQRLLLVSHGEYWYTPGGRATPGESLRDCVAREVCEETGLVVDVGELLHVAEYFEVARNRHKIECYFLATASSASISDAWRDVDDRITHRRFFTLPEIAGDLDVQPVFLKVGTWLSPGDEHAIYRGFERR